MKYIVKTDEQIAYMKQSCDLVSKTIAEVGKNIRTGVTTKFLDKIAEEYIRDNGGEPAFKNYQPDRDHTPYPATLCTSINEAVVHGLPSDKVELMDGDIVSIDCGVKIKGWYGDSAYTFTVGTVAPEVQKLLNITKESLYKGIDKAVHGNRLGDIGNAVQTYCEANGFSVVKEMVGHGIGQKLHEAPEVPNYGKKGSGTQLVEGLVIAIEPMINMGKADITRAKDGWTIVTRDKKVSAHFEHTIVIRRGQAEILTTFDYIQTAQAVQN